jgi:hypothetical protein
MTRALSLASSLARGAAGAWRRPMATPLAALLLSGVASLLAGQPLAAQSPRAPRTTARPLVWQLSMDAGSQYESNVRFGELEDEGDVYNRLSGALTGGFAGPRGRFELEARGDLVRYGELRDLDRVTYDFGMRASRVFTPRLNASFGARAATSIAFGELDGTALPFLPLALARTQSGTAATNWRLSEGLVQSTDLSYTRISFDSPGFIGGSTANGRLALTQRRSSRTTVGVIGEFAQTLFGETDVLSGGLSADWNYANGVLRLHARAGGVALVAGDSAERSILPTGEGEVRRDGRRSSLSLRYSRGVIQSFGLGRALSTDVVGLFVERRLFSEATWRSSLDRAWSEDPSFTNVRLETTSVTSEFRFPTPGGTWIGVGGFLREREQLRTARNRGVFVSAGFLTSR